MGEMLEKLKNIRGLAIAACGILIGLAMIFISGGNANKESADISPVGYFDAVEAEISGIISKMEGMPAAVVLIMPAAGESLESSGRGAQKMAKIGGVCVILKGGNKPEIKQKIIELICALLEVSSNRVFVSG